MPKPAVIAIATMAFLLPIAMVSYQHRDALRKMGQIDAQQGRLLFFTSPG